MVHIVEQIPEEVSHIPGYIREVVDDLNSIFVRGEPVLPSNVLSDERPERPPQWTMKPPDIALRVPSIRLRLPSIGLRVPSLSGFLSRFARKEKTQDTTADLAELIERRNNPTPDRPVIVRGPRPYDKLVAPLIVATVATLLAILVWKAVLAPPDPPPFVQRPAAKVTASSLNCRAEPDSTSEVLRTAMRGRTLLLHDQAGTWRHVRLDGSECWVSSSYLRLTGQVGVERAMTGW